MTAKTTLSRRSMLKRFAAGAVVAAGPQVLSSRVWGSEPPSERLNLALLACGDRTRQLLPSLLRANVNIVAICDVDPAQFGRLKKLAANQQTPAAATVQTAKIYEDYRRLLENEPSVDAVVIAAGQRWHSHMCKVSLAAGKHVFCEKPMAHSVIESRQMRDLGRRTKLATQLGTQGGVTDTFRRSMEIIQAGLLGQIHDVHCWINRTFPPSERIDTNADPIPEGLNWDFWCGPSQLLPFKPYYLGGCLRWGRWLEFGDGHLGDMGAHGLNLPWRALKLGPALTASVEVSEPVLDSYPSANTFKWTFAARENMDAVTVWWHDGPQAGPPEELSNELTATYGKLPNDGVLFVGEKGLLRSNAWGVGGVMKMNGEERFRGVLDHEAAQQIPITIPRMPGQDHMQEWLDACRGERSTYQGFDSGGSIAEIAMVGMVAQRLARPIEWDSEALKVKGVPEADALVQRPQRAKWL